MQKAYNPQTGEMLFLVNDEWVKPQQQAVNPNTGERAYLVGNDWQVVAPNVFSAKPETQEDQYPKLRAAADVPLKTAAGVVQGVRMVADVFGAGSGVSEGIKGVEDWIAQFYSAQSKKDSKEVARLMKEAEDKGVLEQVKAGVKAFSVAPVDMLSSALGTSAPIVVASLASIFGGAPALATRAIGVGLGAAMGAGTVKGSIYEAVKEELKDSDIPKEQIEARAKLAQEYGGKNLDMILAGAALGGLSGVTGLEGSLAKAAAARVMGKAAAAETAEQAVKDQVAKETAKAAQRGAVRQGAVTAGKETGTEFAQAAQEKAAENVALQREGFDVPTMRGVVGAGTLEGLAGAPLGAVGGAREAVVAKQEQERLKVEQALNTPIPPPGPPIQQRIDELSKQYQAVMSKEEADTLAQWRISQERQEERKDTAAKVPDTVKADPARVAFIEDELISAGASSAAARTEAVARATKEAQDEYLDAQAEAEEKKDVKSLVVQPSGEGVRVAGGPPAEPAAGRAEGTEAAGVGDAAVDAGLPAGRKEAEPAAVTPSTEEVAGAVETEKAKPAAPKPSTAPAKTVEELEAEADAADAAYKRKIADAADMGRRMAITAFETRGSYTDLEESIGSLRDNVRDTLVDTRTELGLTKDQEFINAENAAFAAFDKEVERLRAAERPNIADPKFAETPPADTLYRATTEKSRYPGKFWTSIQELADRYLRKATGKEQRAIESTSELPKRALNVTTLSQADEATRKAMLDEFTAWLKTKYPDVAVEDTRLYDVLADSESDFAYPTIYDNKYLQSKGYDSVFFAEEGGEPANTWFIFNKRAKESKATEARTKKEKQEKRGRGRPKLSEAERAEKEAGRKDLRAKYNRDLLAVRKAVSDLNRARVLTVASEEGRQLRNNALHTLYEVLTTATSDTPRLRAREALSAQKLPESETQNIKDTHEAWKTSVQEAKVRRPELAFLFKYLQLNEAMKAEAAKKEAAEKAAADKVAKREKKEAEKKQAEEAKARRAEERKKQAEEKKKQIAEAKAKAEGKEPAEKTAPKERKLVIEYGIKTKSGYEVKTLEEDVTDDFLEELNKLDVSTSTDKLFEKLASRLPENAEIRKFSIPGVGQGKELKPAITKKVPPADSAFASLTTAADAAKYLMRSGTLYQRFMAMRILGAVKGTKFVVVEEGDPLPEGLSGERREAIWEKARGVYDPVSDTVYVRGESFGSSQGVNAETVLHELLHAATAAKIFSGFRALREGKSGDTQVVQATRQLNSLMLQAFKYYNELDRQGAVPADLKELVNRTLVENEKTGRPSYQIFNSPDEFLAYGMSNDTFQAFLKATPTPVAKKSGFSLFVEIIRKVLGLPPDQSVALMGLVDVTDKLIGARPIGKPAPAKQILAQAQGPQTPIANAKVDAKVKAKEAVVKRDLNKASKANNKTASIIDAFQTLVKQGNPQLLADVMLSKLKGLRGTGLRQVLAATPTEALVKWFARAGLTNLEATYNYIKDMDGMRVALSNRATPITEKLYTLQRKDRVMYERLATVENFSTLQGKDPSKFTDADKKENPALAELWDKLTPEAKQLYKDQRDFHSAYYDLYYKTLFDRIATLGIPGDAKDPATPLGKLIDNLQKTYESGRKISPYFPLMRYGQFWVRLGKGKNSKFYMFESEADQDFFMRQWEREQQEAKPSFDMQKAKADGDISYGSSAKDARKDLTDNNKLLRNIYDSLDAATKAPILITDDFGNVVKQKTAIDVDNLKDSIYQMMLQTLPEQSFRKQFIHRQGKEGFSGDIARNFATASDAATKQISSLAYTHRIEQSLDAAEAALDKNPDKARLLEFVKEMRARAEGVTDPDPVNPLAERMVNFANTSAYLYFMTSIKTAVAQFFAMPTFVVPVLASEYGHYSTAKALGKFLPLWNSFGVRRENADGSTTYEAPSVLTSKQVKLNPEERRAAEYMRDRNIAQNTYAYELGNRKRRPTDVQNGVLFRGVKATSNILSAPFHHAERLIREMTFMAAFRLARAKYPTESFNQIARRAEQVVFDSLSNTASYARSRGLIASEKTVFINANKPLGKAILLFKTFPAFVTSFIVRNAYQMMGKGYSAAERKKAMTQLFGMLFMSFTLAGSMGLPGLSFALGVLSFFRNLTLGDDDEDELVKRDMELWFRNVYLPQKFGDVMIGSVPLSDLLDRGLIAALTGTDITSSLTLNNMWLPDSKEYATAEEGIQDFLVGVLGPSAHLFAKQIPRAVRYWSEGKTLEGVEQLLPALARSPVTAYRYATEGATTGTGALIKEPDEFTVGQIIAQGAGFSTEGLVAQREMLFKATNLITKAKNEKASILKRLDIAYQKDNEEAEEKVWKDIEKYNNRNWFDPITRKTIKDSLKRRAEERYETEQGLRIEEKYYPQIRELFEPSSRKLEEEARRAGAR